MKCEMFYGTSSTNFMCSKCFKEDQASKGVKPETTNSSTAPVASTADVPMASNDNVDSKQPEEEKAPARPVQVSSTFSDLINNMFL